MSLPLHVALEDLINSPDLFSGEDERTSAV
jgi:hypothetical protein